MKTITIQGPVILLSEKTYNELLRRIERLETEIENLKFWLHEQGILSDEAIDDVVMRETQAAYTTRDSTTGDDSAVVIPESILFAANMSAQELLVELALHLFAEDRLSLGKARELAGMSVGDFIHLLGSRKIPVHYDVEEYEEDMATLERLGRL